MPLINIIFEERAAVRKSAAQRRLMTGFALGAGALSVGVVLTLLLQVESLGGEERRLQAEVDKMEPILKMIAATQDQYNVLNPRLTTLQDAAVVTQRWTRILDHVSKSCPEAVWLTSMRCNQNSEEEPVRVEVQGLGPTQESISDLILRLQSCMDLENVQLKYTQAEVKEKERYIKFEISGEVVGTAKPKPVEKDKSEEEKTGA